MCYKLLKVLILNISDIYHCFGKYNNISYVYVYIHIMFKLLCIYLIGT